MQGVGAEDDIAKGINFFSDYDKVDVVIVARGGGSAEDLQPFNTEIVANATYNCKKPIVSAVGHETDFTIIDFVSDLRAPTPSAAAECVVNDIVDDYNLIDSYTDTFYNNIIDRIENLQNLCDNSINKICYVSSNIIAKNENKINELTTKIKHSVDSKLLNLESNINLLNNKLEYLNPMTALNKGYVKVEENNVVINTHKNIVKDHEYKLVFKDGTAIVRGE